MTIGAGLVLVALAALVGWRIWLLHRAVRALQVQLAAIPTYVEDELDQLWKDVEGLRGTDVKAAEASIRRAEAAAAQVAREHGLLARRVASMEPWVQHWTATAGDS